MAVEHKIQNIYNQLFDLLSQFRKSINISKFQSLPNQINDISLGENKILSFANRTLQELTSEDFRGVNTIRDQRFQNYSNLNKVIIPNSVTTIGDSAFSNCTSLTSVTIPNSVTTIGNNAFSNCTSLESVNIFDIKHWCQTMSFGDAMGRFYSNPFYYQADLCINGEKITNLIIPDDVTLIKGYSFEGCTSITNVNIGDNVKTIGMYSFSNCMNLTSVTIPDSVTTIAYSAFGGCESLINIYLNPTTPPSLGDKNAIPITTQIHVPIGSGDAYRSATNWSYHSSRIVEDIEI